MKRTLALVTLAVVAAAGVACAPFVPGRSSVVPPSIDASGKTDVSDALSAFVASVPDGSVIRLAPGGRYRMERTLVLEGRRDLTIDGAGATIVATTPGDRTRAAIRLIDSRQIRIVNLTLKGANPAGGTGDAAYVATREAQHGIDALGVDGLLLDHVTVTDTYGDFVYVGKGRSWSNDVTIRNSTFRRNGRMGISITAARHVLIEHNRFDQMRRATFDLEWHNAGFGAEYVTIRDNDIGVGRLYVIASVSKGGPADHITFQGNRLARPLDIIVDAEDGVLRHDWKVLDNTGGDISANPNRAPMLFTDVQGLQVRGNRQAFNPYRQMYVVKAVHSCDIDVRDNPAEGAIGQLLQGGSC